MTKAFPYQLKGVRKIAHFHGRALLADEMGLGKTFQSLMWSVENPNSLPGVIICPASLKWNWQREAAHHFGIRADVLEGTKPNIRRFKYHQPDFVIINYDILEPWFDILMRIAPDLVILDEVQAIKSLTAKRTKLTHALCQGVPNIIALSGTPLTNRPAELYSILHLLRPDLYPNFWPFAHRHCQPRKTRWGWQFKGAVRLKELHTNLTRTLMIRRLKADVMEDLPSKTITVTPLTIERRQEYRQARDNFINWLKKQSVRKAKRASNAQKLVQIGYLKRLAAELKLKASIQWIDDFLESSDEKLIVFGVHHHILKPIYQKYKRWSVLITGETAGRKRQIAVDKFQHDRETRLLIGNVQAAGVGLNMTASAYQCFVELPWTPAEMLQCIDRCHRIGQQRGVNIYLLIGRGTIEEKLWKILETKWSVLTQTLDGIESSSTEDIINLLTEELMR